MQRLQLSVGDPQALADQADTLYLGVRYSLSRGRTAAFGVL